MTETSPMPGRAYTPEQVHENGWLGDISPRAMRTAASSGEWPHTRLRNKIHFTAENIAQILELGQEKAKNSAAPLRSGPRKKQRPTTQLSADVPQLRARPQAARRRRSA